MEKVTWEEIKALASDFKRTQAISSQQRLTERNCIDIINYLCNSKQLSLYFTTDGKTFVTPQELEKEIYEELEISNGRIELTKLSSLLDIDLQIIEQTCYKMVNSDSNLQVVMGNLINSAYSRSIALKINEVIKEKGQTTVLEMTQLFVLPKIFIDKLINSYLDTIIEAYRDGETIYTNNFIRRHSAIIRGYLTRSSKPVSISGLSHKFSFSDKLITKIILGLIDQHRLVGKLDQTKSSFIPDIHLRHQKLYLERFFQQNNYLDFSTMKSLGISNPTRFISEVFDFAPSLTMLPNCALGESFISQIDAAIIDCDSYFDISQLVPNIVDIDDIQPLIRSKLENYPNLALIGDQFVINRSLIDRLLNDFEPVILSRAEKFVRENKKAFGSNFNPFSRSPNVSINDSIDENAPSNKISKFKSGGGTRGREIKVKSVKNKYQPDARKSQDKNRSAPGESNCANFVFLNESDAIDILCKSLNIDRKVDENDYNDIDQSELLLKSIYQSIEKQLNFNFKNQCKLSVLQTSDSAKSKTDHQKLDSVVSTMINKIRLFEKGINEIINMGNNQNKNTKGTSNKAGTDKNSKIDTDIDIIEDTHKVEAESLAIDLAKYNLRTVCAELTNRLFERIATDTGCSWELSSSGASSATSDMRHKLVSSVPPEWTSSMKAINKSLRDETGSFEPFYKALESICLKLDLFFPKKLERKAEKSLGQEIAAQYHLIIESKCSGEMDPGELLLLVTLLIFQKCSGFPLTASGKFVPAILDFLRASAPATVSGTIDWDALKRYQEYVVSVAKGHTLPPDEMEALRVSHIDLHQKIIEIGLNWKSVKLHQN